MVPPAYRGGLRFSSAPAVMSCLKRYLLRFGRGVPVSFPTIFIFVARRILSAASRSHASTFAFSSSVELSRLSRTSPVRWGTARI